MGSNSHSSKLRDVAHCTGGCEKIFLCFRAGFRELCVLIFISATTFVLQTCVSGSFSGVLILVSVFCICAVVLTYDSPCLESCHSQYTDYYFIWMLKS